MADETKTETPKAAPKAKPAAPAVVAPNKNVHIREDF